MELIPGFYIGPRTCDEKPSKEPRKIISRTVKVIQYDLDGKQVKVWENMMEIADETDFNPKNIYLSLNGYNGKAYGYQWKYDGQGKPGSYKLTKPVLVFTKHGDFLEEYRSVKEASKVTGVKPRRIRDVCKGYRNHSGGYIFRYGKISRV